MLKCIQVELDLLIDYDMVMMLERDIRGGIVQCCKLYVKANNKYMNEYDSTNWIYLIYLDTNNLYGWIMSQKMLYADCKCGNTKIDLELSNMSNYEYITEVDLAYLKELLDLISHQRRKI